MHLFRFAILEVMPTIAGDRPKKVDSFKQVRNVVKVLLYRKAALEPRKSDDDFGEMLMQRHHASHPVEDSVASKQIMLDKIGPLNDKAHDVATVTYSEFGVSRIPIIQQIAVFQSRFRST